MNSIQSYIILNRKTNNITKFIIYLIILMFIFFLFLMHLKYTKYYTTVGQVINENDYYQLLVYVPIDKLKIIKENQSLFINNIKYNYKISYIYDYYTISNQVDNYIKVILDIKLEDKDKIVNNLIYIKIIESKEELFYYLKKYLKGE